jgi:hypothetical protein
LCRFRRAIDDRQAAARADWGVAIAAERLAALILFLTVRKMPDAMPL